MNFPRRSTCKGMNEKMKRLIYGCVCMAALLFGASSVKAEEALPFEDYTEGADADNPDLDAFVECMDDGNSMDVSFQTTDMPKEEYHTVTAFKNDSREIDVFGSFRLGIKNEGDKSARMNFSVIDAFGVVFQVKEGTYVFLDGETPDAVPVENGCFEIPAGFDGEAEISIQTMGCEDEEEELWEDIMGYGFVCVSEGGCSYHMIFHDMRLLDAEEAVQTDQAAKLEVVGDESIQRPEVGVSRADYSVTAYNLLGEEMETDAKLSLKSEQEGVSLSEDGCLEISSKAEEGEVILVAREQEKGLLTEFPVTLKRSWTTSVLTDNGYDASLARPEEIAPIIRADIWNLQEKAALVIRALAVIGTMIFFAYYIVVRKKNRRNL